MKKLNIIILLIILILIPISPHINNNSIKTKTSLVTKIGISNHLKLFKDDNIGYINIDKINLKEKLYSIGNKKNNVEENVTILRDSTFPNNINSTMIIAAHSGTGKIAYFKNLDKLNIGDEVNLIIKDKKYNYIIKNKWEEKKTGSIRFPMIKQKQLILTTCSPNKDNYQLIINCTIKE